MSSPHYPQSNGKAEATVKSMKKLIAAAWSGRSLDLDKLCRSLLQYRNMPSKRDGRSPAQKLFGTPLQDTLPAHRRSFAPEWQRSTEEESAEKAEMTEEQSRQYYDQKAHDLKNIDVGSHVAVQNPETKLWDIYGIVSEIGPHRKYYVRTQRGRVLTRNRRFIRKRVDIPIRGQGGHGVQRETMTLPQPRRSERVTRRPQRLIEDSNWH